MGVRKLSKPKNSYTARRQQEVRTAKPHGDSQNMQLSALRCHLKNSLEELDGLSTAIPPIAKLF